MMEFETPEQLLNIRKKFPILNQYASIALMILAAVFVVSSSLYSVGPDEEGIVQRFGQYIRSASPGLHMKIPFGIEKVTNIRVRHVFKEEFGYRTAKAGIRTQYDRNSGGREASYILTGDMNIVEAEWIIQFRIKDPVKMLFHIRNPQKTIRDVTESAMRQVVGDRTVNETLTEGRAEIESEVTQRIQKILDFYECGIEIVTVKLQDVNPPDAVKPSFNDVNEAKQEKEQMINRARQEYNRTIPKARGEALRTIQEAEGYAANRINRAKGEASRFDQIRKEYTNAKEVTRTRLYLETMQGAMQKAGKKYVIDSSQKTFFPFMMEGKGE